jgi:hypothetical protein
VIAATASRDYRGMHPVRRLGACTATIAWVSYGSVAYAETVTLRFDAPAACPAEPVFVAAVADRGGRFEGPEAEARARGMQVNVTASGGSFAGTLRVETPTGVSTVREVHDADCAEVVRGLAVVAAIALGGQAERQPDAPTAPVAAPVASEKPVALSVAAEPAVPAAERARRFRGSTYPEVDAVDVSAGKLRIDALRSYTLMAGVDFGTFPGVVLPRFDLIGALANFVTTPVGATYLVGPVFQLHGSLIGPGTRRFQDYETRVMAFRIGVDICNSLIFDSEAWVISACAQFGGGLSELQTSSLPGRPAYKQTQPGGIGYAGLVLDTQYNLGSLLHVGLRVGGTVNFGSVSAERPDGSQLWESGRFGGHATAGVGMHF